MLGGVLNTFLNDAEKTKRSGRCYGLRRMDGIETHGRLAAPADLAAVGADRRDEAEMLERRRMEPVRHPAGIIYQSDGARLELPQAMTNAGLLLRDFGAEPSDLERQRGELLIQPVVKLSRNALAFLLLCGDEAGGEKANLFVAFPKRRFARRQCFARMRMFDRHTCEIGRVS